MFVFDENHVCDYCIHVFGNVCENLIFANTCIVYLRLAKSKFLLIKTFYKLYSRSLCPLANSRSL